MKKTASGPVDFRSVSIDAPARGRTFTKILRVMKLTALLLTVTLVHAYASVTAQNVTLSGRDLTLKQVFRAIKHQTSFVVFSDEQTIAGTSRLSVNVNNIPLKNLLDVICRDQPVDYIIQGKTIILSPKPVTVPFEAIVTKPLRVRITDETGKPLNGASVSLGAGKTSGVTNAEGVTNLDVQEGDVLLVTYIGYQSRSITVTTAMLENGTLALQLISAVTKLDEIDVVVSTGYQTLSRERSTGSFAKPDMKIVQERSGSMDLLQRLDGLVPGLTLNNSPMASAATAGPAGTGNKAMFPVLLRGLTSVNSNTQPLYVVDGIPLDDFTSINPNDVQDVTVLRDATASSIWGARAANGVIVVTTKKGAAGQPIKVEYNHFVSFQGKPDIDVFPVMNSAEYIQAMRELFNTPGYTNFNQYGQAMLPDPQQDYQSAVYPHEFLLYNQVNGTPLTHMPAYYQGMSLEQLAAMDNVGQMKDLFYRNAYLNNQTISMSGGVGKYGFYASVSYTDHQLPYPGNGNQSYKLNARQDFQVHPKFKIYLITDLLHQQSVASRNIYPDNRFLPYASFVDANGRPQDMSWLMLNDSIRSGIEQKSQGLQDLGRLRLGYTPSQDREGGSLQSNLFNTRLTAGFTLNLLKPLRLEGVYGAVLGNTQQTSYDDVTSFRQQTQLGRFVVPAGTPSPYPGAVPVDKLTAYLPTTGGKNSVANIQQKRWTVRNQLVYDQDWNDGEHLLTALAGMEMQQQTYSYHNAAVYGYDRDMLIYKPIDLAALFGTGIRGGLMTSPSSRAVIGTNEFYNASFTDTRFESYYANAAYTYQRKYSLNLSSRYDRSNMFGTDRSAQSRPVWSVGGSWLISGEKFMEKNTLFNSLKLRATYGITGNAPQPPGAANKDILTQGYANGNMPAGATTPLAISSPANRSLTWEQTEQVNLGIDFSILQSRISGSLEYYHKHTTNLISRIPLNTFAGFDYIKGNLGTINNNGIELRLNTLNVMTRDFTWNSQLNFAWNRGKIIELNTSTNPIQYASQLMGGFMRWTNDDGSYMNLSGMGLVSGYAPFTLFAYRYAGLDNKGNAKVRLADGTETADPFMIGVKDVVDMGTYTPVFSGGFTNTFSWKKISLSVNLIYNLGHVMRRDVNDFYTGNPGHGAESLPGLNTDGGLNNGISAFNRGNLYRDFADRWRKPGDEAFTNVPAYHVDPGELSSSFPSFYTLGDINVLSASYIKARDITLRYGLPANWYQRIGIRNIQLSAQVNNVMVWKANKFGIDPEFQNATGYMGNIYSSTGNYVSVGSRTAPFNQRSFTAGLQVSF